MDAIPPGPIAIDSNVLVYWVEDHLEYAPILQPLFNAADSGERTIVASSLTLLEVLVDPYRKRNVKLAERYEHILTHGRGLVLAALDASVMRIAAQIRASHAVRTPDAIQLAVGLRYGCVAFITNDRRLPDVGIRVLPLT